MILVIDNYDSFTYNLVDYLHRLNQEVVVIRNDEELPKSITDITGVVISPGPGTPASSNKLLSYLEHFSQKKMPLLGICLGHQAIGQLYGMELYESDRPMHGKQDQIIHNGSNSLFEGVPKKFKAVRYNSLLIRAVENKFINIIASNTQNEVMAIEHRSHRIYGLQFHPESISTEFGLKILQNWLSLIPHPKKD